MLTKEVSTLERVQPAFIEPMQVAPVRLSDSGKWSYEAKLDGYRCLAARRSNGVVLLVAPWQWIHGALPGDYPAKSFRRIR
jgi:ATP-dependent DNA ligase